MREKGMLVTCNRCGCTKFLKLLDVTTFTSIFESNSSSIRPGKVETFEDLPEGWTVYNGKDLCPKCSQERAVLMEKTGF